MKFTYFAQPEQYGSFLDDTAECELCNEEKKCFAGESFHGEEAITAVCMDCLADGRLEETGLFTCEGDVEELERQLRQVHPALSAAQVRQLVREKTEELEKRTPALITWQDWTWPCADGDYCLFIGFGSKPLYTKLANDGNGQHLFASSIYYYQQEESDAVALWEERMPDQEIKTVQDSETYGVLFYLFKSIHSDTVVTIWDSE